MLTLTRRTTRPSPSSPLELPRFPVSPGKSSFLKAKTSLSQWRVTSSIAATEWYASRHARFARPGRQFGSISEDRSLRCSLHRCEGQPSQLPRALLCRQDGNGLERKTKLCFHDGGAGADISQSLAKSGTASYQYADQVKAQPVDT